MLYMLVIDTLKYLRINPDQHTVHFVIDDASYMRDTSDAVVPMYCTMYFATQ